MAQPSLHELAKQGDAQSIATLMQLALDSKNIQVRAVFHYPCLHIVFEGKRAPDAEAMLSFVSQSMAKIGVERLLYLRVYGYEAGQPFPQWAERLFFQRTTRLWVRSGTKEADDRSSFARLLTNAERTDADDGDQLRVPEFRTDRFIVCGLGGLGQYCALNLKKFAYLHYQVEVVAIDKVRPETYEVMNLMDLLDQGVIVGDCRRTDVLEHAGIHSARAILFVTGDESANIEGAIAARRLNPGIRIVVRSAQNNLNELLKDQLGGFVALDPSELPAAAYTVAGMASDTLGLFDLEQQSVRVIERELTAQDLKFVDMPVQNLHKRNLRLISMPSLSSDRLFFQWHPDLKLRVGDRCAYVEVIDKEHEMIRPRQVRHRSWLSNVGQRIKKFQLQEFWQWIQDSQARQAILIGMIIGFILWATNTIIFITNVPKLPWHRAAISAVVLILGGYGDVFATLNVDELPVPPWVEVFALMTTLVSIIYVLGVLGLIADNLISSKFDFLNRGVPMPEQDHIVLIGFGRLGQKIANLLYELNQPMVIISRQANLTVPPQTPYITSATPKDLTKANVATARSVVAVTDNQMFNLEVTLLAKNAARSRNRNIDLVIRTQDQFFSENLEELLPKAKALSVYALSAEAFAGAAFGEDMLNVFRLNRQTVLVAEYEITPGDTLVGKTLSQIAYGYDVVPLFLQTLMPRNDGTNRFFLPSDDELLNEGDRLVVLSSISGLRRIEQGEIRLPRRWQIYAKPPLNANIDISNKLSLMAGCDLETARDFVEQLPGVIELNLYDIQAYRLGTSLAKMLPLQMLPL